MTDHLPENSSPAQWVEQLYSPQTRRRARQRLVAARAVEPLLECLRSTNESVVWAAVVSLGELRAAEAREPLIELLERGKLEMDVCDSLARITGTDLGTDPRQWRKSLGGDVQAPALDATDCISRAADHLGATPTGSDGSYRLKLSLPDGRTQKVAVFFGRRDTDGHELVVIYSECGPAVPKYLEAVLRKNMSMPSGAFAIRDIDGVANFVVVDTMMASSVTPGALARKIEQIASRADQVEELLTQEDRR
ncbi:MAG: hypothetical protein JW888_12210 [Pirellulales bacterium]|nr:hypothetical protein [Pirellulales bacterium]